MCVCGGGRGGEDHSLPQNPGDVALTYEYLSLSIDCNM